MVGDPKKPVKLSEPKGKGMTMILLCCIVIPFEESEGHPDDGVTMGCIWEQLH